jgi:hypothetical protein
MKRKFSSFKSEGYQQQMGVTIHFEGQLLSNAVYDDLIATITAIAERQNWLTAVIESSEVTLLRVRDEKDWDYTGPVKAIAVHLDDDCDPVRLEFDRELYMQEFTKTQFARVECHLKVLDLLRSIQPFFRELKIEDEGEYWETRNRTILEARTWSERAR